MDHNDPIKILGAGPAGLTAAIVLARAGQQVIVYEREVGAGMRRHGDLEAFENWTTREDTWEAFRRWGLVENFSRTPLYGLTIFGPGFQGCGRVEDSDPLFYWVRRGSLSGTLDQELLHQAVAAGVRVEFGQRVRPEEVDIQASGLRRPSAFAVGYTFKTHAPNSAYICLDDALSPKGYSYLVICEGHGTITADCIVGQPTARSMRQNLDRVIAGLRQQVKFDFEEPRYFSASISFGLPQTANLDGRLLVGEAGGFQDLLSGFGMRMGMTSGYLAAHSLLTGKAYDAAWQTCIAPIQKATAVNRWVFEKFGNRGYAIMVRYSRLYDGQARRPLHLHYHPRRYTPFLLAAGAPGIEKRISDIRAWDTAAGTARAAPDSRPPNPLPASRSRYPPRRAPAAHPTTTAKDNIDDIFNQEIR